MDEQTQFITIIPDVNNQEQIRPKPKIVGSFTGSFIIDTFVCFSVRTAIVAIGIPVISMNKLSITLQSLIVVSPLVAAMFTQIPMTWHVHQTGGKTAGLIMIGSTLIGMSSLTLIYGFTDNLRNIDRSDWRYGLILSLGALVGCGSGSFQLVIDALKWAPRKAQIANLQMIYALAVDAAAFIAPIATYYLGSTYGYHVPYVIYSALLSLSLVLALLFLQPSPYNQLKTQVSKKEAKNLAIELGQLPELIGDYDSETLCAIYEENLTVLLDRRSLLLGFSLFSSLGSFFISRTILPKLLINEFGFNKGEAISIAATTVLISILVRPLTSKLIIYADSNSGGIYVFLLGCVFTLTGMTPMVLDNLSRVGLYCSLGSTYIGFGMNMVTPLNIATKWSKPKESQLKEVNPSTMFGIFGTIGSLGGILLPLIISLLVDNSGGQWYTHYFYIIMAMMLVSAIGVPIVDHQLNSKKNSEIFSNRLTFFSKGYCQKNDESKQKTLDLSSPRTIVASLQEKVPMESYMHI